MLYPSPSSPIASPCAFWQAVGERPHFDEIGQRRPQDRVAPAIGPGHNRALDFPDERDTPGRDRGERVDVSRRWPRGHSGAW